MSPKTQTAALMLTLLVNTNTNGSQTSSYLSHSPVQDGRGGGAPECVVYLLLQRPAHLSIRHLFLPPVHTQPEK